MALQTSGNISLVQIRDEFGALGSRGITDFYRGGTYVPNTSANLDVPTSGEIKLTDFYGASGSNPPIAPSSHSILNPPKAGGINGYFTDNSSDETSFRIEYQVNGGSWNSDQINSANDTTYTSIPYAIQGDSIVYRIRSENASGVSIWVYSNTITSYNSGLILYE